MKNYGDTTPPYPLLVVRPDGIETYGAARKAMQDWDDQFGYELVPADVKLAFAQPDSNLKQHVEIAIREAAARQYARDAIVRPRGTRLRNRWTHASIGWTDADALGRNTRPSRSGKRISFRRRRLQIRVVPIGPLALHPQSSADSRLAVRLAE